MNYKGVFIGVNYNSSKETIDWVNSIISNSGSSDILIIVVDTSAELIDKNLEIQLNHINTGIVYINPNSNLGYFGGARCGIDYVNEEKISYDFLIVSNVDILFKTKDFVNLILNNISNEIGLISPSILVRENDINPYRLNKVSKKELKRRLMYLKHPNLQWIVNIFRSARKKLVKKRKYDIGTSIYMTYGACFIFTKFYFEKCDINLPLFLYGEEPYVAEQCRKNKLRIIYNPSIVIEDIGHVSTKKIPSKTQRNYLIESTLYCLNNYYGDSDEN